MNDLELIVQDGKYSSKYTGWKEVSVNLSLNRLAGIFEISAVEELYKDKNKWDLKMGQTCTVKIKGQTIITGFIDCLDESYDEKVHRIDIKGRDKTCDLVDCSYVPRNYQEIETHEWNNQTALSVITEICVPYNISIDCDPSVKVPATELLAKFKINIGETSGDAIKRICNAKGIMPMSRGDGKLYLTRAGTDVCYGNIVCGKNVKKGHLMQSDRERFSHYIVRGKGISKEKYIVTNSLNPLAVILDEVVMQKTYSPDRRLTTLRYRPRVLTTDIIANFTIDTGLRTIQEIGTDTQIATAEINICAVRGEQEARIRAGKSRALNYTLYSWYQDPQKTDKIWGLNKMVFVSDPTLKVNGNYLITDLRFNFSESNGSTTDLILMNKNAYTIIQKPIKEIRTDSDNLFAEEFLKEQGIEIK